MSDTERYSSCAAGGHAPNYFSSIDGLKSHWPLMLALSCCAVSLGRTNTHPHLHMCAVYLFIYFLITFTGTNSRRRLKRSKMGRGGRGLAVCQPPQFPRVLAEAGVPSLFPSTRPELSTRDPPSVPWQREAREGRDPRGPGCEMIWPR